MKIKIFAGLILSITVIFINSCVDTKVTPANLPSGCDTANLTYTGNMQIMISLNCGTMNASCHSSSGTGHDFTSYASLQKYVTGGQNSRFWREIYTLKEMPLYPELSLDPCTSNQFKVWLLDGAPQ